jgi:hypothetical protein
MAATLDLALTVLADGICTTEADVLELATDVSEVRIVFGAVASDEAFE